MKKAPPSLGNSSAGIEEGAPSHWPLWLSLPCVCFLFLPPPSQFFSPLTLQSHSALCTCPRWKSLSLEMLYLLHSLPERCLSQPRSPRNFLLFSHFTTSRKASTASLKFVPLLHSPKALCASVPVDLNTLHPILSSLLQGTFHLS